MDGIVKLDRLGSCGIFIVNFCLYIYMHVASNMHNAHVKVIRKTHLSCVKLDQIPPAENSPIHACIH